MLRKQTLFGALWCLTALAAAKPQDQAPAAAAPPPPAVDNTPIPVDADGKYTIEAEGIRAQFIPYGASLTNLFVADKTGVQRDIVLGYDNASYYSIDTAHPHLGGVPGRYANRIKNSTFTIDGVTSKILANENGGLNTLHGGPNGWDWRNFTVVSHTRTSIVFRIDDPDGEQGFPGAVTSYVYYGVSPYRWHIFMNATATKTTPIMLSSHVYWNLDGFQNTNTNTALNHSLALPFSGQRIEVDGILIPTGNILPNKPGSVNDFWTKPKQMGEAFNDPEINGNCGTNCKGYDNCYLVNRAQYGPNYFTPLDDGREWWEAHAVASLRSEFTGIQVDVYTDQDAFQVYGCGGQNGTMPIKKTQGFSDGTFPRTVPQYGCVVLEVQDYIDGINNPAWLRDPKQIIGPESPAYVLEATYAFSAYADNA